MLLPALMLIDAADPRYGGAPDPDEEREKRWQPIDKRISLPFLGAMGSMSAAATATTAEGIYAFTLLACGFTLVGAKYALARREPETRVVDDDVD